MHLKTILLPEGKANGSLRTNLAKNLDLFIW